jgi:hypothetical protein
VRLGLPKDADAIQWWCPRLFPPMAAPFVSFASKMEIGGPSLCYSLDAVKD